MQIAHLLMSGLKHILLLLICNRNTKEHLILIHQAILINSLHVIISDPSTVPSCNTIIPQNSKNKKKIL